MRDDRTLAPETEIRIAVTIGGAEVSAKFTVDKEMSKDAFYELVEARAASLAVDVFAAFTDAIADGIPLATTIDEDC